MLKKAPMDRYQNLAEVVIDLKCLEENPARSSSSSSSSSVCSSDEGSAASDTTEKHRVQMILKICLVVAVLLSAVGTFVYWLQLEGKKSASNVTPAKASERRAELSWGPHL